MACPLSPAERGSPREGNGGGPGFLPWVERPLGTRRLFLGPCLASVAAGSGSTAPMALRVRVSDGLWQSGVKPTEDPAPDCFHQQ